MKNIDKIQKMSVKDLADLLSNSLCRGCIAKELCNQYMITSKGGKTCKEVLIEWLEQEHIEPKPMPKIKIGDALSIKTSNISNYFYGVVIDHNIVFNEYFGCKEISDPKYTIMAIMNFNKDKKILETVWKRETDDK